MTTIIIATIFGICHGDSSCIEAVKDLQPKSQVEVVHAFESLYDHPYCSMVNQ